ncbi:hypothetical protein SEUCBS140593_001908 [Sporothrix eucalyptigena]|uniref:Major facilitator superfamily (MFS) profile domain-containing protein n=1 Tax=Sporothrix eucalyptigena TaxID=1812306 RepID=A0ABP0B290_9PEZI
MSDAYYGSTYDAEKKESVVHERPATPDSVELSVVSTNTPSETVLGSTELYENGQLRYIPMPTPDPKDPLNMPNWRKWTAIIVMFGSLGLAAEVTIGALLPVFLLEYSGINPVSVLSDPTLAARVAGGDLLSVFPPGTSPKVTLAQVSLLATIPQIANGIAGYFLIPLSAAIGRRPVLLVTAIAAWAGGFWAGASQSLTSHIAARVVHGLGAGAVEALLPLIVQDMVFIHQRARATAAVIASQGIFIVVLGIAGPWLAAHYTWRWVYWITSALGLIVWILIIVFVPETKWNRTPEELSGQKVYPLAPGEMRPRLDPDNYGGPRTKWTNYGVFQKGVIPKDWKKTGLLAIVDPLVVSYYPAVLYVVVMNVAFMLASAATQQSISVSLLAAGVPFEWTGISGLPSIIGTGVVYLLGGIVADKVGLFITRRLNNGQREPEHLLPYMSFTFLLGIAGCFVFGTASENATASVKSVILLLVGNFLLLLGSLILLTTTNVFVIESYPQKANAVIVSASSLKIIATFFLTTQATTWLQELGALRLYAIFAEMLLIVSALGLPLLFIFGKRLRQWTSGTVKDRSLGSNKSSKKEKKRLARKASYASSDETSVI